MPETLPRLDEVDQIDTGVAELPATAPADAASHVVYELLSATPPRDAS